MDRVGGGPLGLLALEADAGRYDDVLLALRGEAEAATIAAAEAKVGNR